jgi:sterol desaturase/sphingolipid hydroxylase (fatty acid hydroxylase superfamily)
MIITNALPTYFTMLILPPKPSYFQFILISTYKVFIEISGHLGKKIKSGSFTQCIWIPKLLDMELKVDDHDRHHSLNNCNYSKRFSLYDKFFGTYK